MYRGVYPGIDLVYYGKGRELEYDLIIAPGADPAAVQFQVEGADRLHLDRNRTWCLQRAQAKSGSAGLWSIKRAEGKSGRPMGAIS